MNIEELKCALQNGARQETARLISRHFAERRCVEGAVGDILRVLSFCPPEERIYLLRQSIQHAPRETALYVELVRHQLQQQEYEQAEWWWGIAIPRAAVRHYRMHILCKLFLAPTLESTVSKSTVYVGVYRTLKYSTVEYSQSTAKVQ